MRPHFQACEAACAGILRALPVLVWLAAGLGLVTAGPARAQSALQKACSAHNGAAALDACSHLIAANEAKGTALYVLYNNRGGAHQAAGTPAGHQRAMEDFAAAIAIAPNLPFAYINRGVSWAALGAFDRAIEDFESALRVDPRNARAFNNRGGAHRDRGEFDAAMRDFNRALALDPQLVDALFNRGTLAMQREDYTRAIADYGAVLRTSPRDILALAARGRAWTARNDDARARADFEAALAAPAPDEQARLMQEAVRELLQALLERRAARERDALLLKQAERERKAEEERLARLRKEHALAQKAEADRQAAARKQQQEALRQKADALRKQEEAQRREQAALRQRQEAERRAHLAELALRPASDAPRTGERMALVIGNAAYDPSLGRLDNPTHDATDVARGLKQLGFVVWFGLDLGHIEMKRLLGQFSEAAGRAQTALVFYSGHGFQYGPGNFLAPVDAPISDEASIARHVRLDAVMSGLRSEHGARILIIDACRNNLAVERTARESATVPVRAIQVRRGFAQVQGASTWPGGGMLIAFATLPGDVASDGAGRNSPFTQALVKHLQTPGLELRHLFVRVRAEVIAATQARQVPQVSDALNGEYVFKPRLGR